MTRTFADRLHAGRVLAGHLTGRSWVDPIVLALPRGGVCIAQPVAEALGAPLEVLVARKLGAPSQPELAIGAIAEGGPRVIDDELRAAVGASSTDLHDIEVAERRELERRVLHYRDGRSLPSLTGRDVVLIDDGVATGLTAQAAVLALRGHRPRSIVFAVPVGPPSTIERLRALVDEVVCLEQPEPFGAVGTWYDEFRPVADRDVIRLLRQAPGTGAPTAVHRARRMLRRGGWRSPHEGTSRAG